MHLEAKHPRLVAPQALGRHQARVHLEQDVLERRAEVGAIYAGVPCGLGVVQILAFGAVQFDRGVVRRVVLAGGQQGLRCAHYTRTFAEFALFVFLRLGGC